MKTAILGGNEFTVGFRLAGVKEVILSGDKPINDIKALMTRKDIGIVVVDEKILDKIELHQRIAVEASVEPVFIPLSTRIEQDSLKRLIKKSIGVDLWR